ncbi:PBP1A family penicillin-binding protein [Candidatus Obscuribacterales bacterium]|nr:PBP1A family penicillin-binding protein [Candidatus Obscuribacterales bacterium]
MSKPSHPEFDETRPEHNEARPDRNETRAEFNPAHDDHSAIRHELSAVNREVYEQPSDFVETQPEFNTASDATVDSRSARKDRLGRASEELENFAKDSGAIWNGFVQRVKLDFGAKNGNGVFSLNHMSKNQKVRKVLFLCAIAMGSIIAVVTLKTAAHISFVKLPTLKAQKAGIEIYDRYDKLVTVVQKDGDREPVALDATSPYMRQAVIGIEDHSFYHHMGVDPLGITRAIYTNAKAHEMVQGGSTITQQLMKTMYFGFDDRTARRKILEMFMALDVETCYSKDKIMETYLNTVYFGRGAYGIQRAAITYFNKPAKKLSLEESAFLAGLIKAPSDLSKPSNLKRAKMRQQDVLDGMVECGFISKERAQAAKAAKLTFKAGPHPKQHPYYVNQVVALVKEEIGEERLFDKPIKIYTNLDVKAQKAAEVALSKGVVKAPNGIDQGALVSIDIETGGVIAMVGGVGQFEANQWNRAVNPHTAGSSFKPFVYLAGLINGTIGPDSVLNDSPIAIPLSDGTAYTPQNFDGKFKGIMTVRDAIALSRNVCAVQVGQDTGINNVVSVARKAGLNADMEPTPALALGTCAVSPLEMATAYGTLARGGEYVQPLFVRHINERDGKLIKEYVSKREKRFEPEPVLELVDCLQDVVKVGTGTRAKIPGVAVAGKTGTADDSKDVWFVGFTPDVVTAVWAGNDENHALKGRGITGGVIAAGIWSGYMSGFYKAHPKPTVAFVAPEHPLTHSAPYYAMIPATFAEATEDVVDGVQAITEPIVEAIVPGSSSESTHTTTVSHHKEKKHGGFFRKLSQGFKKIF